MKIRLALAAIATALALTACFPPPHGDGPGGDRGGHHDDRGGPGGGGGGPGG